MSEDEYRYTTEKDLIGIVRCLKNPTDFEEIIKNASQIRPRKARMAYLKQIALVAKSGLGNTGPGPHMTSPLVEAINDTKNDIKSEVGKKGMQSYRWCFTYNFDQSLDPKSKEPTYDSSKVQYLIYQLEKCPTTGRLHWQGYAEFLTKRTIKGAQEILGIPGAHMAVARGTAKDNNDYCSKDRTKIEGTFKEFGKAAPGQGYRADLAKVQEQIIGGNYNPRELIATNLGLYAQYGRRFEEAMKLYAPVKRFKTKTIVFVGPADTGKTTMALDLYPNAFVKDHETKQWWDGYANESAVIMDNFSFNDPKLKWIEPDGLNNLIDARPVTLQVKGGTAKWTSKTIIITTRDDMKRWPTSVIKRIDEIKPMMTKYDDENTREMKNMAIIDSIRDELIEINKHDENKLKFAQEEKINNAESPPPMEEIDTPKPKEDLWNRDLANEMYKHFIKNPVDMSFGDKSKD